MKLAEESHAPKSLEDQATPVSASASAAGGVNIADQTVFNEAPDKTSLELFGFLLNPLLGEQSDSAMIGDIDVHTID